MFIRYQHIEKLGTPEVDGIIDLVEPCYVFPKIDGTNGSVWAESDGLMHFGSRNRELSLDNDNLGFMAALHNRENLRSFFREFPNLRLYGEWLVPHTLKTYTESAWREFYVFDVCSCTEDDGLAYMHYDEYKALLDRHGIEYVPCYAIVHRGTIERFQECMERNGFLMNDGEIGEGIVIKRYGFVNRYGRTTWAKMVRNDFKAKHLKAMGPQEFAATAMIEESIVSDFVTTALVDKVHAKIVAEEGEWRSQFIPRLLHTVFYDLVREETWNFVKKYKNPTIDFKALQKFAYAAVKSSKPDLF